MSESIARLQGLLERVRRNVAKPRGAAQPVSDTSAQPAASGAARAAAPTSDPVDRSSRRVEARRPEAVPERPTRTEPRWPVPANLSERPAVSSVPVTPPAEASLPPVELELPGSSAFFVEEPVASSQRPKLSEPDRFEETLEARQVPLVTPPPESGPQRSTSHASFDDAAPQRERRDAPARLSLGVPRLPSDLVGPAADTIDPPAATVEQLGQTVDLGEPLGPALELAMPSAAAPAAPAVETNDDLEMALPTGYGGGTYDESLVPPPSVHEDLRRHRERADRYSVIPAAPASASPAAEVVPSVVKRAAPPDTDVTIMVNPAQRNHPATFIGWLEASLALRAK